MTTDLERCAAAGRRWRIGPYEFEHYASLDPRKGWGCLAHGYGAAACPSPAAAFLALHRRLHAEGAPGILLWLARQHVRSFRRERGGLYAAYVAVHSRCYGHRMRSLHSRGQHGATTGGGLCEWCGAKAPGLTPDDIECAKAELRVRMAARTLEPEDGGSGAA